MKAIFVPVVFGMAATTAALPTTASAAPKPTVPGDLCDYNDKQLTCSQDFTTVVSPPDLYCSPSGLLILPLYSHLHLHLTLRSRNTIQALAAERYITDTINFLAVDQYSCNRTTNVWEYLWKCEYPGHCVENGSFCVIDWPPPPVEQWGDGHGQGHGGDGGDGYQTGGERKEHGQANV